MGREIKRVALDFQWPEDKVWSGYINPHYEHCHTCAACNGTGTTTARQRLSDLVSLLMLSASDVSRNACHPYFQSQPLYHTNGKVCGQDIVSLTEGLAGRKPSFIGHDATDKWRAESKIIEAAGLTDDWGICPECEGEGSIWADEESERLADEWTETEPPSGDGYQIWETVSEGSPISPVFATPEELAQHMAGRKWGADKGSSYESWLHFITGPGWAPSGVMDASGYRSGPDAARCEP